MKKLLLVKNIQEILAEDHFKQESLPPLYKEALDLFTKQRECMDYKDVNLKPWQEDLLKHIEIQTDRLIIWVAGRKGGEGKTWFQEFIASRFGWDRVVCGMDIKVKKASICHALRKRPLTTTDIFLFNVGKSFSFNDVNYEVLEKIKDGRILASKFDSMELRFKTPNVVVVYSNDKPKENQL